MIKLISELEYEQEEQEEANDGEPVFAPQKKVVVPLYQRFIYSKLYNNLKLSRLFDNNWLLNLFTLGMHNKLVEACAEEVETHTTVLQFGATFGNQLAEVAEKVGYYGRLYVMDVNRTQLNRIEEKYETLYPQMNFVRQNAEEPTGNKFDTVICYMLLHELPIASKIKVVENALNSLTENGKAVFIDYSQPTYWHPLRYIVRMFNRLYQPFAEKMWDRTIDTFTSHSLDYIWHRRCYFGGMYQKVVATKRPKMFDDD